jgi:hypothetical protein
MASATVVDILELSLEHAGDAVLAGAWPMAVVPEALAKLKDIVRPDFELSRDRLEKDLPEVRRMARHIGAIAAHIAAIQRKGEISKDILLAAAQVVNDHCDLREDKGPSRGRYCTRVRGITSL